jgi:hypothetical protein
MPSFARTGPKYFLMSCSTTRMVTSFELEGCLPFKYSVFILTRLSSQLLDQAGFSLGAADGH